MFHDVVREEKGIQTILNLEHLKGRFKVKDLGTFNKNHENLSRPVLPHCTAPGCQASFALWPVPLGLVWWLWRGRALVQPSPRIPELWATTGAGKIRS